MTNQSHKIASVVGARPQFIKLAAFHRAVCTEPALTHVIIHSGQHYDHDMSEQFFKEFNLPEPNYNLGVGSLPHNLQIARCLEGLDAIYEMEKPDLVVVYGDTNTTAAGAIAAAKRNIPLAHIEAGLREFDKSIPEEVNKLITDALTDLYFTPTETGRQNLAREGRIKNVYVTGDISLDLIFHENIKDTDSPVPEPYVFATCHRASNTENRDRLKEILTALGSLGKKVIFPVHPRTRAAIESFGFSSLIDKEAIKIMEPCGFFETQRLIRHASFVVTDSGGVIKESYFHKVPCLIIDSQTEWMETVEEGWSVITGPKKGVIVQACKEYKLPGYHSNCLGDGKAGRRIVEKLKEYLNIPQP